MSAAWTFLSNHGHVLVQISRDPDVRIRDIADEVGITERRAHMILGDLEAAGYITITKVGRRSHYRINRGRKFRHPAEAAKPIGALLEIFDR
jgi:DNA-binding MarR family transcriptional regulator